MRKGADNVIERFYIGLKFVEMSTLFRRFKFATSDLDAPSKMNGRQANVAIVDASSRRQTATDIHVHRQHQRNTSPSPSPSRGITQHGRSCSDCNS